MLTVFPCKPPKRAEEKPLAIAVDERAKTPIAAMDAAQIPGLTKRCISTPLKVTTQEGLPHGISRSACPPHDPPTLVYDAFSVSCLNNRRRFTCALTHR